MKVLHVIPSISPALGGPTQVVLNLVDALRAEGIDAEIVTTNDNGAEVLDVPLNQRVIYQRVPVWFLPRFPLPMKEFIFSAALTRWLWQHVRDYDVLDNHYLFSYAPTCAGAIARWQQVPYTVRTMGQLSPWALAQSRRKKQIYTALIERHNLQSANAIHCTTAAEADDVRRFGLHNPLVTLPLGAPHPTPVADARAALCQLYGIPLDRPVLLFLSRLHYKKRPDLLLSCLQDLQQRGIECHLILAGSGESDYEATLRQQVAALNLGDRVTFTGFVTGPDKNRLLQGADVFVLPSFSENFGIAVVEAMAVGLPVVLTQGVQIAPEVVEYGAGLVVDGTIAAMTGAIAHLLESPDLRQRLGNRGRQLAIQRYDWRAIARQLSTAYEAIAHRAAQPTELSRRSR